MNNHLPAELRRRASEIDQGSTSQLLISAAVRIERLEHEQIQIIEAQRILEDVRSKFDHGREKAVVVEKVRQRSLFEEDTELRKREAAKFDTDMRKLEELSRKEHEEKIKNIARIDKLEELFAEMREMLESGIWMGPGKKRIRSGFLDRPTPNYVVWPRI